MTDQPRADAIAARLHAALGHDWEPVCGSCLDRATDYVRVAAALTPADPSADHVHGLYWCDDCLVEGRRQVRAALAPADPQHEHYGEACPACAAEAAPADPTADAIAALATELCPDDEPCSSHIQRAIEFEKWFSRNETTTATCDGCGVSVLSTRHFMGCPLAPADPTADLRAGHECDESCPACERERDALAASTTEDGT